MLELEESELEESEESELEEPELGDSGTVAEGVPVSVELDGVEGPEELESEGLEELEESDGEGDPVGIEVSDATVGAP